MPYVRIVLLSFPPDFSVRALSSTQFLSLFLGLLLPLFAVTQTTDADLYSAAITDAQNPEPKEVSKGLTVISPENTALEWKSIDGQQYVKMVTWKAQKKYYPESGPYNTGKYAIWVTAAPFVQQACSNPGWAGEDVNQRLAQALGLPPGSPNAYFVVMWVRPEDLFRPCPDAEITDNSCSVNWPKGVSPAHREWINDLRSKQYFTSAEPANTPYPWTQLGYTYDWSPTNKSHIGFSEFIVRENVEVVIDQIYTTAEYCKR